MSSASLPIISLGTYNGWGQRSRDGLNSSVVRGLIWHVKDNRQGKFTDRLQLAHACHGGAVHWVGSPLEARAYCADVLHRTGAVQRVLFHSPIKKAAFVPIPSSSTTAETMHDTRWPALELARLLERSGGGRVRACLAQKAATAESKGSKGKLDDLLDNLVVLAQPPADEAVVFVDDVITTGEHMAAAALKLPARGALVVGATPRPDAVLGDALEEVRMSLVVAQKSLFGLRVWDLQLEPGA